jgi:hypothetical protein
MLDEEVGHALATEQRVELILVRVHERVDTAGGGHADDGADSMEVICVETDRIGRNPRPHHAEADHIDAETREEIHVVLHEAEVGVEGGGGGVVRLVFVDDIYAAKADLAPRVVDKAGADGVGGRERR